MSDTEETAEATAPSNSELDARIDGINAKLDVLIDKLGTRKDAAHAAAEEHTEDRLDRPSNIAEQIRAQLEHQRAADADAAKKLDGAERLAALEERVSGMTEQVPEPPQRRIEKRMGWR
jgi:hypothetical protein